MGGQGREGGDVSGSHSPGDEDYSGLLCRKDVRLPVPLQRAMAAEAEAARETRAKVIAAEGEEKVRKEYVGWSCQDDACRPPSPLSMRQT